MLETVYATRYVTPLREGGSLPAIVEASDLGYYVLKFRGAGQGPLALVAELLAAEIGRALDLRVPETVFMEVDAALGRNEEDPEIRDLLRASVGLNLGIDYLPGALAFDPAVSASGDPAATGDGRSRRLRFGPDLASAIVWFDAFLTNVDRTARNANLLWWHQSLYLIDHGAALYFHHNWQDDVEAAAMSRFPAVREHVLLPWASRLEEADRRLRPRLGDTVFRRAIGQLPDSWLAAEPGPEARRAGYLEFLNRRLAAAPFVEEAVRARAQLV
jgi:hypothetical protein